MDRSPRLVYPRILVWRVRVGIVAALFVAVFALWSALLSCSTDPAQVRWMYAVMIGAAIAAVALIGYNELLSFEISVDADGVALLKRGAEQCRLRWGEITRVRFRRTTGELAVSGARTGTRIRIDARLIGFDALAGRIESRTGRAAEHVWF